nr:Smr/MutS family protein [Sphingomicrobium nitratireducens]
MWAKVAATIEPLSRDGTDRAVAAPEPAPSLPRVRPARRSAPPSAHRAATPPPPRPHRDATLDGGWDKRLAGGKVAPDRVIDLHGHRLDDAWEAIDFGIEQALHAGDRLVLLITGHAPRGEPPIERGRIRAAVEGWLSASRHAGEIAAVRGAHPRHGGRGALYLVLRRKRPAR